MATIPIPPLSNGNGHNRLGIPEWVKIAASLMVPMATFIWFASGALNSINGAIELIKKDVFNIQEDVKEMREQQADRIKVAEQLRDAVRDRLAAMDRRDDRQDNDIDNISRALAAEQIFAVPYPKRNNDAGRAR